MYEEFTMRKSHLHMTLLQGVLRVEGVPVLPHPREFREASCNPATSALKTLELEGTECSHDFTCGLLRQTNLMG